MAFALWRRSSIACILVDMAWRGMLRVDGYSIEATRAAHVGVSVLLKSETLEMLQMARRTHTRPGSLPPLARLQRGLVFTGLSGGGAPCSFMPGSQTTGHATSCGRLFSSLSFLRRW